MTMKPLYDHERLVEGLKPCPFCGCKLIKTYTEEYFEESKEGLRNALWINRFECVGCEIIMWSEPGVDYDATTNELINRWNHRTEPEEEDNLHG